MLLSELLKNVEYTLIQGDIDLDIDKLTIDSRQAKAGTLFVCISGFTTDGHKYIPSAAQNGCNAVLCEKETELPAGVTGVFVPNGSREALAKIASVFYGEPSKKFKLIGVTGTNGKTSSTYFLETILRRLGHKTGVIGTVGITINGEKQDIKMATSTTPDTIELQEIFAHMAKNGVDEVIMEVSSHGLALQKVDCSDFDIGIFTNLTQDHLDFHKTMENYCDAKAKLFKMCKTGIVNADDKWSEKIIAQADCGVKTFGMEKNADIFAKNIVYHMDKVTFTVDTNGKSLDFTLNVPGRFSVYNALGVIGAALALGIGDKDIIDGIAAIKGVPGRIQNIPNDRGINVIVDYAHTPDGVENILNAVREFTKGRVLTVFGCGGDRDRTKRPIMGEIAGRLSDYCFVTSDNPRSEEPIDILHEIEPGIKSVTDNYSLIIDRRDAIFAAVKEAKAGDSVVIAGKGHEDYEIFKDRTIHFDDAEVASEALKEL
ncbi:MAG: UDP-N-acetylmuramoyl-L-alanyl-D-glutamate--2,6-diaminopimelate ligase [Firmicutes bacterium]|nr:UDP-N-acetylmuramoyl-L-alanyl-D-glutamate--2,6-diaminopimelate ligase [Bacillota bacterium]MBQ9605492.1 UDP-N-acetylmuramoyl-L-alanyl-D-glutamate--2,6-diaminopimelate ligase [Bacillota bacterium]